MAATILAVGSLWLSCLLPSLALATTVQSAQPDLVWHVETADGEALTSSNPDRLVNPASVVKIATSLWAIERLGLDYRYETEFRMRGSGPDSKGRISGDLLVAGGADPDFHSENAFLVAEGLNRLGVREVDGKLVVDERFWIGWEGGSNGTDQDTRRRELAMAERLRRAFDPGLWRKEEQDAWRGFAARRGIPAAAKPRIVIRGGSVFEASSSARKEGSGVPLVIHRSQPLMDILKRFNVFSNNDIERLEAKLGTPDDLARFVSGILPRHDGDVAFSTTSGLGHNRLSLRAIVGLLRALRTALQSRGHSPAEVLAVMGCGTSTLTKLFPSLHAGRKAEGMIAKTGTLVTTDGGVSALAGFLDTKRGDLLFAVVAPESGKRLREARKAEEAWVSRLIDRFGAADGRACDSELIYSDSEARIVLAATQD